ncbi:unnamed protein product [Cylicocyclus nassatus]|uniref:Uncharacterized protein n=1 Tax=Cylicocyclus nassatus TaxID=53992 RepID=A0AA36GQE0_CYLNA|nr:unnamed protein product [Cylicocyclus nassatus]
MGTKLTELYDFELGTLGLESLMPRMGNVYYVPSTVLTRSVRSLSICTLYSSVGWWSLSLMRTPYDIWMIAWIAIVAVIVQFTVFCRRRSRPTLTQFDLGKARHEPETYNPVLEAMLATSFNENLKTCLEMSIRDGIPTQDSLETLLISVAEKGGKERAYEKMEEVDMDFFIEKSREKSKESTSAEGQREEVKLKKLQETQPDLIDYGTLEDPGEVKVKEMRSLRVGSLQHLLLQLSRAKAARLEKNKASGSEPSSQEAKRRSKAQLQKASSISLPTVSTEPFQVKASTLPTTKATFGDAKPMKMTVKSKFTRPVPMKLENAKDMRMRKNAVVKSASAEVFATPRRTGKRSAKKKATKRKRK